MSLTEKDIQLVTDFVKREPRTVQEISKLIKRSWVTTDSYLKQMAERTGMISIKTFRKGSQGALKVVYYNYSESLMGDSLKENLYHMIRQGRRKSDFDFMDVFQYVEEKKKRHIVTMFEDGKIAPSENLTIFFRQAASKILIFSGNLSFINVTDRKLKLVDLIEETVKRGVVIKILCRVNIATMSNIMRLQAIMEKYPGMIEVRHGYQPLRGFVFDDKVARFKNVEESQLYEEGELEKNTAIFYEIYDPEWVNWLEKIFWSFFRTSIDYDSRLKEIRKITG
jgi:predicted transcriptional regulator